MVGRVFEIRCTRGDRVEANQIVAVIESMKMEVPVIASATGSVSNIQVAIGDVVNSGTVIMILD
jgi:biotin carboxyl carrier protein